MLGDGSTRAGRTGEQAAVHGYLGELGVDGRLQQSDMDAAVG
jgi:hypothetical protein